MMNMPEHALDRSADEVACQNLVVDFANHIDARRYQPLLDLFAEDGTLDRMGLVLTGRNAIASFLDARPADAHTRHLCTNIRVNVESEDLATGFCYVLFFQGRGEETPTVSGPPSIVEYHDRYVRTPAGWRIRERLIRMSMRSS